jgi:hypothetical protein
VELVEESRLVARIRTIKPEFFRHEELYEAEKEEGLPMRVAYAGLWTAADREGRFRWSPRQLKLDCLPFDDVDFSRVLDALATRGFIVKYAVDGKEYGHIPSWDHHQIINNREKASDIPEPNEINTLTREARVDDASGTLLNFPQGEGKGKEGKVKEGKGKEIKRPDGREYEFEGEIVKLTRKSFSDWTKGFPNIDLRGELTARDAWLSSDRATSEDKRNWFISTSKYLANRNMEARAKTAAAMPNGRPQTPSGNPWPEGII